MGKCKTVFPCAVIIGLFAASSASADIFNYIGSIQTYDVSTSGVYGIFSAGAQGGGNGGVWVGGLGATVGGEVFLTAGTMLDIVVGGQGLTDTSFLADFGAGGGGGSFVYIPGAIHPLEVAGGGGGAAYAVGSPIAVPNGGDGQAMIEGQSGFGAFGGPGGLAGSGGIGGTNPSGFNGGGAAGWFANGFPGLFYNGLYACAPDNNAGGGGSAPPTFFGGAGVGTNGVCANGGFGGGGGGGYHGGGGGGGYSGGGGGDGDVSGAAGGGGGGSYIDASFIDSNIVAGDNVGNGLAGIDFLYSIPPTVTPTPEPASILLLGTLVGGLALAVRKRSRSRRSS